MPLRGQGCSNRQHGALLAGFGQPNDFILQQVVNQEPQALQLVKAQRCYPHDKTSAKRIGSSRKLLAKCNRYTCSAPPASGNASTLILEAGTRLRRDLLTCSKVATGSRACNGNVLNSANAWHEPNGSPAGCLTRPFSVCPSCRTRSPY